MLYSKSWDNSTKTPEELMDLSSIVRWLKQRPLGDRTYQYLSGGNCLLAQYYKDHGYEDVRVTMTYVLPEGRYSLYEGRAVLIPDEINSTIRGIWSFFGRRSFKGALKRARRRLAQEEQAYAL